MTEVSRVPALDQAERESASYSELKYPIPYINAIWPGELVRVGELGPPLAVFELRF